MPRGVCEAAAISLAGTLLGWLLVELIDLRPSPGLCSDLATIGAALLIAYAVETAWIVEAANRRLDASSPVQARKREERVGRLLALGAAGLLGIALALVLSDRAGAGAWHQLDQLAFAAACSTLLLLGITVVLQPLAVHEWSAKAQG